MANGQECWEFGSTQYVRAAIDNVEEYPRKRSQSLPAKAPTLMASQYRPKVDISKELEEE
jgi:hypothetical protein